MPDEKTEAPRDSRPPARRRAFRLAAVALALGGFLVAAEVVLRVQLHLKRLQKGNTAPEPMEPDEQRGWCATPLHVFDAAAWRDFSGATYPLHFTTDERGLRGTLAPRTPSRKRLLVLGDSFTHALDASDDRTFHARLREPLGIDVAAYGCCGYGTLQELMTLDTLAPELAPDAVLLQLCQNDFIDNDLALERESSWSNQGKRRPYLADDGAVFYAVPKTFPWVRTTLQPHSAVVDFVVSRLDRLGADRHVEAAIESEGPTHPGFQHSCRITGELLRRFQKRAAPAPVFAFEVSGGEPFQGAFRLLCRDAGIVFLDGVPDAVKAAEARGVCCRGRDDQHWNEVGHAIVAEALAPRLREAWLAK